MNMYFRNKRTLINANSTVNSNEAKFFVYSFFIQYIHVFINEYIIMGSTELGSLYLNITH